MKKLVTLSALAIAGILVAGRDRPVESSVPYAAQAPPLRLDFAVNKINMSGVELQLRNPAVAEPMFLQFGVAVRGGRPVVTLSGAGNRSNHAGAAPQKDALPGWSFLKAADGSPVLEFSFETQLVRDPAGNPSVRMTYVGRAVPLISTLVVERPTTMPPFISERFGVTGPIQFVAGTYTIDATAKAFVVPVRVLGR